MLRQMERSIWIVKVPREEEQLGGAVKETTAGVERQVVALICRKRASRDKRRTTSTRFRTIADIACRVSPSIPTGTVAEEKRKRPPSATRVKAAETCRTLTLARTGNQHQVI
jgi:hypothetical protein